MKIKKLGSIVTDQLKIDFVGNSLRSVGQMALLLDVGCNDKQFKRIYEKVVDYSIGIDIPSANYPDTRADVQASALALAFKQSVFDTVLCTEVMEHVSEPLILLEEIQRVLKPGGMLILTTPFMVGIHDAPYDFYRYTRYGLKYLCEKAGFTIKSTETFGDQFGVMILFGVQIQLRFWRIMGNLFRFPRIHSLLNPFIFLFVYLPQVLYLFYWSSSNSIAFLKTIMNRMSMETRGYGIIAVRK